MPRPTAFAKENCTFPVRLGAQGWQRAKLLGRYDAAVRHLVRTPKGSILWDLRYGTLFEKYRTQPYNQDDAAILLQDLAEGFKRYLSDLILLGLDASSVPDDEERIVWEVSWELRGAAMLLPGESAKSQVTQVAF